MVRMVLPLPHIIAFCKDNAIVGMCPDPSSSPCDGSRSETNGTLHAERKQRVLFHYSRSCKIVQLYSHVHTPWGTCNAKISSPIL